MRRISVGDIMTRNPLTASPVDSLFECAKKMVKNRVDSLLIAKNKRLFGILTSRDILWTITKKPSIDLRKISSIEIATKKVAVIKPSAEVSHAIKKMKALNFRRLPVLSRGELIGVITLKDILRIEPTMYSEVQEMMGIREEERKLKELGITWPLEGFCDNCGAFSDLLKVDSKLLCSDCREDLY